MWSQSFQYDFGIIISSASKTTSMQTQRKDLSTKLACFLRPQIVCVAILVSSPDAIIKKSVSEVLTSKQRLINIELSCDATKLQKRLV